MCKLFFEEIVERGLRLKHSDAYNGRHRAWEYCHDYYLKTHEKYIPYSQETLCMHLALYLSNWGMYRGSSALLFNDYFIHKKALPIIFDKANDSLWDYNPFDNKNNNNNGKVSLPKWLFDPNGLLWEVYNTVKEKTNYPKKKSDNPQASETLITKIMLGTWGCVPAYDTFLKKGLNYLGLPIAFSQKNLEDVVDYFGKCPKVNEVISKLPQYTSMKIIDAYLWELGFELYLKDLLKNNPNKYPYVYNNYHYDRPPISINDFNNKRKEEKEKMRDALVKKIEEYLPQDGECYKCGKVISVQ